jgi:alkylhydroperoxidase family enzyme
MLGPMTFIATVPEDGAPTAVAQMYDTDRTPAGAIPHYTEAFSHRPEVYAAWRNLVGALRQTIDDRRYELATLAAARQLRSSYCALAHGAIVADRFDGPQAVIADDFDETDRAIMDLAAKVADDATQVTQADIDGLRERGLTDAEVFDVVATAALRCFFSKTLDGLGVQPDAWYAELEPGLRGALEVGRPIASS